MHNDRADASMGCRDAKKSTLAVTKRQSDASYMYTPHKMSPEDFEKLLFPMSAELYRRALGILHNEQDAEDAVQDVFAKLWHERDRLMAVKNLKNYLHECLRNHSLSLLRKRREATETEDRLADMTETGKDPLERAELHSDKLLMQQLIANLPPKAARILSLHLYAEMKPAEIARHVGDNEQNVRATLSRYRRKLVEDFRRCIPPDELTKRT